LARGSLPGDLFSKRDNVDYIVSLLHGLIAGIDRTTAGKLSPGQARDLSVPLPYIPDHLNDVVQMTGDPHEEIQKQARRLVERFPVDGFKTIYDEIHAHVKASCDQTEQIIKWGSIFFYYNRIIQYMYGPEPLSKDSRAKIDEMTRRTVRGSECLNTVRRLDAAAIYFARAVVFDHMKEPSSVVTAEIKKFKDYVQHFGGPEEYYSPNHFDTIGDLQKQYAK
jgi:hypothetical protein